jgi:uncharacterized repeat protein (TIGR01451 family)
LAVTRKEVKMNSNNQNKHRFFLLTLIILCGLCALLWGFKPASAKEAINTLFFETTGQSLGDNNDLSFDIDFHVPHWDYTETVGDIWEIDLGLTTIDFGAEIEAGTKGDIGFSMDFNKQGGSVDVDYPVKVTLEFPDPNTFRDGETISISSSAELQPGWRLDTVPPKTLMSLGGDFVLSAGAEAELCLVKCTEFTLFGVWNDDPDINIFNLGTEEGQSYFPGIGNIGLPHEFTQEETFVTGFSGRVDIPEVETEAYRDGKTLIAKGEHDFIDMSVDLDTQFVNILGGSYEKWGAGFSWEFFGLNLDIQNTQYRRVEFSPTPMISLWFPQSVCYNVKDGAGKIVSSGTAENVEFEAGHTVYLTFPIDKKDPMDAGPTFSLDNRFSHKTENTFDSDFSLTAIELGVYIPEIDLVVVKPGPYSWSFGPLLGQSFDLYNQTDTVFDRSWELGGFGEFTGPDFALDPENPIINVNKEVSKVVNNGAGSRTIIYTIRVRNGGDVPLYYVQVSDMLEETFPQKWASYTVDKVHSCELGVNSDFDGTHANANLLMGTDILDDGVDPINPPPVSDITNGIIVLQVTVEPEPFPPLFGNIAMAEGTSPIGTLMTDETGEGDAVVNLGPGDIDELSDFVLYADHKVAFKDVAFVRGHVGSNGGIEIQKGDSGVVAGDLRAFDVIDVHGQIVVDYVFTNQSVKETGKGTLWVTGGITEFDNQDPYELQNLHFDVGGEDVTIQPEGELALPPGRYGILWVLEGARVTLESGEYFFERLYIETDATVLFNVINDPISINVADNLEVQESAEFKIAPESEGTTRDITINAMQQGNIKIRPNAIVCGILVAPNAKVTFQDHSKLEGAAYARIISLENGVNVQYHDDWYGSLYKLIDTDCDGIPNPDFLDREE